MRDDCVEDPSTEWRALKPRAARIFNESPRSSEHFEYWLKYPGKQHSIPEVGASKKPR